MIDMDKISSDERTIKIGKALIVPDMHIQNPLVIASYQGYSEILKELTQLKNIMKEMVEGLEFYGDRSNWNPDEDYWDYENVITGHDLEIESHSGKDIHIGGKRARELLQKHKELIERLK
jgi:hypothetical protein